MVKVDLISKEKYDDFCNDLIGFFEEERDEKIGIIQAQKFIDFTVEKLGAEIFNKGVESVKLILQSKFEEIDFDLEELKFL